MLWPQGGICGILSIIMRLDRIITERLMTMDTQKIFWGSPEARDALSASFAHGLAVLAESDTVWGLLTPALRTGAIELDRLKKRRDKPYLVLMGSLAEVENAVVFPNNGSYGLAHKCWPGPITLLLPAGEGSLLDARSEIGTVGIRVPDHEPLRRAAQLYGGLFSTSANISGQPVPTTFAEIPESIRNGVGAIIYNNPNYTPQPQPSTIVDCSGAVLKVVRQGAYSL